MNRFTTIFKYPLPIDDWVGIEMPLGATVLCVQVQGGVPCIWARVDPDAATAMRRFRVAGTGHHLEFDPKDAAYVGTVQLRDGALVLHVFDLGHVSDSGE